MHFQLLTRITVAVLTAGWLCSCASLGPTKTSKPVRSPLTEANLSAHAAFRLEKGWKLKTFRDDEVMAQARPDNMRVEISIVEQRGILWVDALTGLDFPVSTGRRSHPTPTGEFKILVKEKEHHSNLYGRIVDATGLVVVENADAKQHPVAEDQSFEGAPMPFFMRLSNDGVGMHVGYVPGRPASHGCIRLRRKTATELFALLPVGTPVSVVEKAEPSPELVEAMARQRTLETEKLTAVKAPRR